MKNAFWKAKITCIICIFSPSKFICLSCVRRNENLLRQKCASATYCENNCSWTFIMMIILLNFHSILSAHQLSNAIACRTQLLNKKTGVCKWTTIERLLIITIKIYFYMLGKLLRWRLTWVGHFVMQSKDIFGGFALILEKNV